MRGTRHSPGAHDGWRGGAAGGVVITRLGAKIIKFLGGDYHELILCEGSGLDVPYIC